MGVGGRAIECRKRDEGWSIDRVEAEGGVGRRGEEKEEEEIRE